MVARDPVFRKAAPNSNVRMENWANSRNSLLKGQSRAKSKVTW